ncbi:SYLC [Enterospora canceri]|uniref:SYLC n=1 Tax=Enterospora canceri TaxID=1081671 RepID=A0A1Y1S4B5_9MICR|nr:SYLC [Enterospora canceri]
MKEWAYYRMMRMLYPIIPSYTRYLMEEIGQKIDMGEKSDIGNIDGIEYVKEVVRRINMVAKKDKVVIKVAKKYSDWKEDCMKRIQEMKESGKNNDEIKKNILEESKNYSNSKMRIGFSMDYLMNMNKYQVTFDEVEYLNEFKGFIEKETKKDIQIEVVEMDEKAYPMVPYIYY